jgi:hypothetical protein
MYYRHVLAKIPQFVQTKSILLYLVFGTSNIANSYDDDDDDDETILLN